MIFAIAGNFSVYKKPRKEFLLLLMDTLPCTTCISKVFLLSWSKGGFLTPSFKIDATVNSSNEDSVPVFSLLIRRQGRHPAFGGWHEGQTIGCHRLSSWDFGHHQVRVSSQTGMVFLDASIHFENQEGNSRSLPIKGHTNTCKVWGDEKTVRTDCRCCEFPYAQKLLPDSWLEKLSFHTPQNASTAEFHTNFPRLLATQTDYIGEDVYSEEHLCSVQSIPKEPFGLSHSHLLPSRWKQMELGLCSFQDLSPTLPPFQIPPALPPVSPTTSGHSHCQQQDADSAVCSRPHRLLRHDWQDVAWPAWRWAELP